MDLDPASLATAAASAVGGYLSKLVSGVADRAADETEDRLYQFVSARLGASRVGSHTLRSMAEEPDEAGHRESLVMALADEINRDPQFGAELASLINGGPIATTVVGDANFVDTGSIDNRRAIFATGGSVVDQSRTVQKRFSLTFLVVVFVAILVLGGATSFVVIESNEPEYPELEGDWRIEGSYGSAMVIHIKDDRFRIDAQDMISRGQCSGEITSQPDGDYLLTSTEGICAPSAIRLDGDELLFRGDDGELYRFTR